MSDLNRYDQWITDNGMAALVLRQPLVPVEGRDGVFFPATYAAQLGADKDKSKFQGGYNIDEFEDKTNVCLVDSVGSQANRIEPIFTQEAYARLVPQIAVTFPEKGLRLSLLLAHHRAADAIIRSSPYEQPLRKAFQEVLRGNAEPLARLAPTSLVFGVWDSRDTYAKVPRLVSSTIRAFNVRRHTRSANFLTQQTIDVGALGILPGAESEEGFANALASKAPGGVQLTETGSIRRDAVLSLAALRRLTVLAQNGAVDADGTVALRRYILGLSLVALTAPQDTYLRQGCNLVPDIDTPAEFLIVGTDGTRVGLDLTHPVALEYATLARAAFAVEQDSEQPFDAQLAAGAKGGEERLKGAEVIAFDAATKSIRVRSGKGKDVKDVEIATSPETQFKKGKQDADFASVVTVGAKLDVSLAAGVATNVTGKK